MTGPSTARRPSIWRILREASWALRTRTGRLELQFSLASDLPGNWGALIRERILRDHFRAAGPGLRIYRGVRIRNIQLVSCGAGVHIGDQAFLQAGGGLTLGDHVLLGPGVKIWTQNHLMDDLERPIVDQGAEYKPVVIDDDCWIGANAFIMPGVHLPRGCVVAAGSVVGVKMYQPYQILMGNPARPIGLRKGAQPVPDPGEPAQP